MTQVCVATVADVPEGSSATFQVQGYKIAVFHVGDTFYALDDTCSHADASLGAGELDEDELCVECPRHGSLFELESGRPRTLPAHKPVATYAVSVEDGNILVDIPTT
jgi:3-phenylpropionate/trans-cinnamate dioxygenase ferredoxin subunit